MNSNNKLYYKSVLKYLNDVLEKNGFKSKGKINLALRDLKKYELLNETDYEIKKDKVNLIALNIPYPLSWILYTNPEIKKSKLETKLDFNYKEFIRFKPKMLRIYSKTFEKDGIKFTKKELTEKKINLEDIINISRKYYKDNPFIGILYKTPYGIRIKQYIVENHDGIKHALKNYNKITLKSNIYNKNAVVLVPSRSRNIMHKVELFNLPIEKEINPYYDIYKFYTNSTTESKVYHDITSNPEYKIISAIDVSAFMKLIKELWRTDKRITQSPILIPNKEFSELIELTSLTITYDQKYKRYRFLNKTERELIASINFVKNKDFELFSNLKGRNIKYYYDYIDKIFS